MFHLFLLVVLYISSSNAQLPPPRPSAPQCGKFCKFDLCNNNGTAFRLPPAWFTLLNTPRAARLPFICRFGIENITTVTRTGEPRVFVRRTQSYVPLSLWRPSGLKTPFKNDDIEVATIPKFGNSGFVRKRQSSRDQWSFLDATCMIVPILEYKVMQGNRERVKRTRGGIDECVSVRFTAPELQIGLRWGNDDDMDLDVIEPSGAILGVFSLLNNISTNGRLLGDNSNRFCGTGLPSGNEDAVYVPGRVVSGTYGVEVRHVQSCLSQRLTRFTVRVIRFGRLLRSWSGVSKDASSGDAIPPILSRTFQI